MKIYTYSIFTREYLGKKNARRDPLETKKQGKDWFLIPANCTDIKPPNFKKNEMAVFDSSWSIVDDYRRTIFYDVDGNSFEITDLRVVVPQDCTIIKPPQDFKEPHWDGSKWIDNYVEPEPPEPPDPDKAQVVITVGVYNQLKAAKNFSEFIGTFKTIGG